MKTITTVRSCVNVTMSVQKVVEHLTGNESVPILLAQCRFPGLAIFSAKILIYFSNKIYRNNFIKQHSETVIV